MSLSETHAAALAVILAGFDGVEAPKDLLADLGAGLGGVVVFKRNVETPAQVAALLSSCRLARGEPIVAAVDQEGGRVVRLREPLTVLPPMRRLGAIDLPAVSEAAGRLVGAELRALGFTANFAPVLDVDTNPHSPVIGDRSFGSTPELVARHGLSLARGLRDGGVVPVAKHFPGHGDASLDSHAELPRIDHGEARLAAVEMEPFSAYVRAGLGAVMTAHVLYPALDPSAPATVSRPIVTGLLRQRLRHRGVVLSDDLEMGAISRFTSPEEAAVLAIDAGVDGVLVCRSSELRARVAQRLMEESQRRPAFARRLEVAGDRLRQLAAVPALGPDLAWIGSTDHLSRQARLTRAIEEGIPIDGAR